MFLGIDFGTSFSQVSTMYLGQPLLLLNPGEYGIPSEFYYDRDCGILIGQDALDAGQGEAAAVHDDHFRPGEGQLPARLLHPLQPSRGRHAHLRATL